MSDLLINGMEMPERCIDCPLLLGYHSRLENKTIYHCTGRVPEDSRFAKDVDLSKRPKEGCPLVEVKPHGRLIDADKLTDTIISCIRDAEKEYPKKDFGVVKMVYESCLYHVGKAQTVLEASDGNCN